MSGLPGSPFLSLFYAEGGEVDTGASGSSAAHLLGPELWSGGGWGRGGHLDSERLDAQVSCTSRLGLCEKRRMGPSFSSPLLSLSARQHTEALLLGSLCWRGFSAPLVAVLGPGASNDQLGRPSESSPPATLWLTFVSSSCPAGVGREPEFLRDSWRDCDKHSRESSERPTSCVPH